MKKKRFLQLLLLFLVLCGGFLIKPTTSEAASYVKCSSAKTKAGSSYIWVKNNSIRYSSSKSGESTTLVTAESGTNILSCLSNGSVIYYVSYTDSEDGLCTSYIYKYNIAKSKNTLIKKSTGIKSLDGYYSGTLYMQKTTSSKSKIVGLNLKTGKFTSVVSNAEIFSMNGKYIVYQKSTSVYYYNITSKSKKKVTSKADAYVGYVVVGSTLYYPERISSSKFRLCECSMSSGTKKTLISSIAATAVFMGVDESSNCVIVDALDFLNGTEYYWNYNYKTGSVTKQKID